MLSIRPSVATVCPRFLFHLCKSKQMRDSTCNGWFVSEAQRLVYAESQTQAKLWLIDCSEAEASQSNAGSFTAQDLRKKRCIHLTASVTRRTVRFFFPKAIWLGASLLQRSKQPLDHTIMEKNKINIHPRVAKTRLPSTSWGYGAPPELLNATKPICISVHGKPKGFL